MKILYIRRFDDIMLKSFINNYRLDNNVSILDAKNFAYYKKGDFGRVKVKSPRNKYLSYLLRYLYSIFFLITSHEKFDVVHILNIKRENCWMIPFLKKRSKKIIVSVYGRSTFTNKIKRKIFKSKYQLCDYLTFTNKDLIKEFLKYHGDTAKEKIIEIPLPVEHFKDIRFVDDKTLKKDISKKIGIKPDKINILCSTTVSSNDQQKVVIEQIKKIRIKKNVQLIFLLTYGGNEDYKQEIINKINSELRPNFEVKIFDKFLSNERMAELRKAIDIMINIRVSDQFAGALVEAVRAGSCLLIGEWLNYSKLDDLGIKYYKIGSDLNFTQLIDSSIENIETFKNEHSASNSKNISKFYNIDEIFKSWDDLYDI